MGKYSIQLIYVDLEKDSNI